MHPAGKQPQGRGKGGGGFPQAKPTPGGRGWEQMLLGSKVLCGHRGFTAGVEAVVLGPACCRNGHKDGVKRTWEQWPPWLGRGAVGFIFFFLFFFLFLWSSFCLLMMRSGQVPQAIWHLEWPRTCAKLRRRRERSKKVAGERRARELLVGLRLLSQRQERWPWGCP